MGKAVVQSHLGEGRYVVEIKKDHDAIDAEIADMYQRVSDLVARQAEADAAWTAAKDALSVARADVDTLFSEYDSCRAGCGEGDLDCYVRCNEIFRSDDAVGKLAAEQAAVLSENAARRARDQVYADHLMYVARLQMLEKIVSDEEDTVWCADYSLDLGSTVGTIEIPNYPRTNIHYPADILIQPGFGGNADYVEERDGILVPLMEQTPEAWFWNYAMQPAWGRYRPTYRKGTVTEVPEGEPSTEAVGEVSLDPEQSTPLKLDINQITTNSCTFRYMSCHQQAFAVGDRVVVEFPEHKWRLGSGFEGTADRPVVIGFLSSPLPCCDERIWLEYAGIETTDGQYQIDLSIEMDEGTQQVWITELYAFSSAEKSENDEHCEDAANPQDVVVFQSLQGTGRHAQSHSCGGGNQHTNISKEVECYCAVAGLPFDDDFKSFEWIVAVDGTYQSSGSSSITFSDVTVRRYLYMFNANGQEYAYREVRSVIAEEIDGAYDFDATYAKTTTSTVYTRLSDGDGGYTYSKHENSNVKLVWNPANQQTDISITSEPEVVEQVPYVVVQDEYSFIADDGTFGWRYFRGCDEGDYNDFFGSWTITGPQQFNGLQVYPGGILWTAVSEPEARIVQTSYG